MTLDDYRKLAQRAKETAELAKAIRVTGQQLLEAGFNSFAAKLLAESFADHPAQDKLSFGLCFSYGELEVTLGPNVCRSDLSPLADAVLALCDQVEALRPVLDAAEPLPRLMRTPLNEIPGHLQRLETAVKAAREVVGT